MNTPETIEERIKFRITELRHLEMYFTSDNRAFKFFQENAENTDELIINEKISAINNGIIETTDIPALAQQILALPVDEALDNRDLSIVEKMADLNGISTTVQLKHMSSEYCAFHHPRGFPVQSPKTIELISLLQQKAKNPEYHKIHLDQYEEFAKAVEIVVRRFELGDMNYLELNKFFWLNASRIEEFVKTL